MSKNTDDKYTDVLLEDINSKIETILELVGATVMTRQDGRELQNDIKQLKSDMKIVKAAVTDTSGQINDHERRIIHLETQIA